VVSTNSAQHPSCVKQQDVDFSSTFHQVSQCVRPCMPDAARRLLVHSMYSVTQDSQGCSTRDGSLVQLCMIVDFVYRLYLFSDCVPQSISSVKTSQRVVVRSLAFSDQTESTRLYTARSCTSNKTALRDSKGRRRSTISPWSCHLGPACDLVSQLH
jgi:hypothetical protein